MKTLLVVLILVALSGTIPHTKLITTKNYTILKIFKVANPLPINDDNQEDWQLVPDDNGKLHLVDIKSSDVNEVGPTFVGMQDIVFRLYTRNNPNVPQVIRINNQGDLANSFFNPSHQTRFMIHGWLGGGEGYDDNGK